jgi:hypothetical protein
MNKFIYIFIFLGAGLILVFHSCKHSHDLDPVLKEAQIIQDDAIHLGIRVDSIIDSKLLIAKDSTSIQLLHQIKSEIATWRSNMVDIPGSKHKCNHDHGEHVHLKGSDASHLTPAENKKVQKEWKAVIDSLNLLVK